MSFTAVTKKVVLDEVGIRSQVPLEGKNVFHKQTTGLVGLRVCREPQSVLCLLYDKIFRALRKMPDNAAYKKYTLEIISYRLNIVKKANNAKEIEEEINCGQCEELIVQAENELYLARRMAKWKPWEKLISDAPPNQWTWPPPKCS